MLETPNRNRIAERQKATRQEILAAAWEVARDQGLAQLTLRQVAEKVGMQPPSLYSHFASKHAIYDAMYAQAWTEYLEEARSAGTTAGTTAGTAPVPTPRATLRHLAHTFFDFAVADLARHQLMNQRTIAGFAPSAESYTPAVAALELFREQVAALGLTRAEDVDLCTAMVGGLVDAQLANDPGGERWARLLDRAVDMFSDNAGLPPEA